MLQISRSISKIIPGILMDSFRWWFLWNMSGTYSDFCLFLFGVSLPAVCLLWRIQEQHSRSASPPPMDLIWRVEIEKSQWDTMIFHKLQSWLRLNSIPYHSYVISTAMISHTPWRVGGAQNCFLRMTGAQGPFLRAARWSEFGSIPNILSSNIIH